MLERVNASHEGSSCDGATRAMLARVGASGHLAGAKSNACDFLGTLFSPSLASVGALRLVWLGITHALEAVARHTVTH